jgi:ribonuclease Y
MNIIIGIVIGIVVGAVAGFVAASKIENNKLLAKGEKMIERGNEVLKDAEEKGEIIKKDKILQAK